MSVQEVEILSMFGTRKGLAAPPFITILPGNREDKISKFQKKQSFNQYAFIPIMSKYFPKYLVDLL